MSKNGFVVALTIAALGISISILRAQKPANACGLLTTTEIQTLAGSAKIGDGVPSTDPLGSMNCRFKWGTGNNVQSGVSYLDVGTTPISKAYPGTDLSLLKQGLLAKAKSGGPNAEVVAGVGDGAMYESNAPIRVETTAFVKGNILIVTFESQNARAQKNQVIALLKAAAGRL
jgi:hypothetical protein